MDGWMISQWGVNCQEFRAASNLLGGLEQRGTPREPLQLPGWRLGTLDGFFLGFSLLLAVCPPRPLPTAENLHFLVSAEASPVFSIACFDAEHF